jgi:hypothetical protein
MTARAGRLTFRRVFPRFLRLLLTLLAVLLAGFYGAANAAKRPSSGWAFKQLPVFVNLAPRDVRERAVQAMRAAAKDDGPEATRARAELLRLGGAALPHVLPQLDSLEPSARGPYCGSIGWLGFDGWMDTSITIRTFAVQVRRVAFQAGGGIVADSEPAAEYTETLDKAKALLEALGGRL